MSYGGDYRPYGAPGHQYNSQQSATSLEAPLEKTGAAKLEKHNQVFNAVCKSLEQQIKLLEENNLPEIPQRPVLERNVDAEDMAKPGYVVGANFEPLYRHTLAQKEQLEGACEAAIQTSEEFEREMLQLKAVIGGLQKKVDREVKEINGEVVEELAKHLEAQELLRRLEVQREQLGLGQARTQGQVTDLMTELRKLVSNLETERNSNYQMRQTVRAAEEQTRQVQSHLDHMRQEVSQKDQKIQQAQEQLARTQHSTSQYYSQNLRSKDLELHTLSTQNRQLISHVDHLKQNLEWLQEDLKAAQSDVALYHGSQSRALTQIRELETSNSQLQKNLDLHLRRYQEEQVTITYTRKEMMEVSSQKASIASELSLLQSQNQQLELQAGDLTQQLSNVKSRAKSEAKIRHAFIDKVKRAEEEKRLAQESVVRLQRELESLTKLRRYAWQSEAPTKEQLTQIESRERELNEKLSLANHRNEELESELETERTALRKQKGKIEEMEQLKKSVASAAAETLKLRISGRTAERKARQSEKQVESLARELDEVKEEAATLTEERRELKTSLDAWQAKLTKMETSLQQSQRKVSELESMLGSQVSDAKGEVEKMEQRLLQLVEVESERDELKEKVQAEQSQNTELKSSIEIMQSQAVKWKASVASLQKQVDEMRNLNVEMGLRHRHAFDELQYTTSTEITKLNKQKARLNKRLKESDSELATLKARLDQTMQRAQHADDRAQYADDRLTSLRDRRDGEFDDVLSKNVRIEEEAMKLELDMAAQAREMKNTIDELTGKVEAAVEEQAFLVKSHEAEIGKLSTINTEQKATIDKLTAELQKVNARLEKARSREELTEMELELDQLRRDLALAQMQLNERQFMTQSITSQAASMANTVKVFGHNGEWAERNLESLQAEEDALQSWRQGYNEDGLESLPPQTLASISVPEVETRNMSTQTGLTMDEIGTLEAQEVINDGLQKSIKQLNKEVSDSEQRLREAQREHERKILEMERAKDKELAELTEQLCDKGKDYGRMHSDWSEASDRLMSLRVRYDETENEAEKFQAERNLLRTKVNHLTQELEEIEGNYQGARQTEVKAIKAMYACAEVLLEKFGSDSSILGQYVRTIDRIIHPERQGNDDDEGDLLTSLVQQ
ncbi:MAG: hypothetical protein ACR2PT_15120 [Endozoicomonas sp.]